MVADSSSVEYMPKESVKEVAGRYQDMAWVVVPVKRNEKKPFESGWQKTTLGDSITKFKTVQDGGNIALLCGKESGVFVIDVDNKPPAACTKCGPDQVCASCKLKPRSTNTGMDDMGPLWDSLGVPELVTPVAMTGSNGLHIYFKWDDRLVDIPGRSNAFVLDGKRVAIDIRTTGNCCILYPSVHPNGNTYEWKPGYEPWSVELASVPDAIIEHLRAHNNPPRKEVESGEVKQYVKILPATGFEGVDDKTAVPSRRVQLNKIRSLINLVCHRNKDYDDWRDMGLALHSMGPEFEDLFVEWSQVGYVRDTRHECRAFFQSIHPVVGGLTLGSIIYWAKTENPVGFQLWKDDYPTMAALIMSDPDEAALAQYIQRNYLGDDYICCDHDKQIFYRYNGTRWLTLSQRSGVSLRQLLRDVLSVEVIGIKEDWERELRLLPPKTKGEDTEVAEERKGLEAVIKKAERLAKALRTRAGQNEVLFNLSYDRNLYKPDFEAYVDAVNPHLLAFEDGVYDLERGEIRPGHPNDMVSFSVGYNFPRESQGYEEEIMDNFRKLWPDPAIVEYKLNCYARALNGARPMQIAHMDYGPTAGNGKSMLAMFLSFVLGDYYKDVALSWFCVGNRTGVNQSDAVAHSMKGRRYVNLNEGDTCDVLHAGRFKLLTGEDTYYYRLMYSDTQYALRYQALTVMSMNNMITFNGSDEGLNRRLREIHFDSRFVAGQGNPANHEYPSDPAIKEKMKRWAPDLMRMLLQRYDSTWREAESIPRPVLEWTRATAQMNNPYDCFVDKTITVIDPVEENNYGKYLKMDAITDRWNLWKNCRENNVMNRFKKQNGSEVKSEIAKILAKKGVPLIGYPTPSGHTWYDREGTKMAQVKGLRSFFPNTKFRESFEDEDDEGGDDIVLQGQGL